MRVNDQKRRSVPSRSSPEAGASFRLDLVVVPTTVLLLQDVARFAEVGHDPVGGALGDVEGGSEVPEPGVGPAGDEDQGPSVVGQEAPVPHGDNCRQQLELHLQYPDAEALVTKLPAFVALAFR